MREIAALIPASIEALFASPVIELVKVGTIVKFALAAGPTNPLVATAASGSSKAENFGKLEKRECTSKK